MNTAFKYPMPFVTLETLLGQISNAFRYPRNMMRLCGISSSWVAFDIKEKSIFNTKWYIMKGLSQLFIHTNVRRMGR